MASTFYLEMVSPQNIFFSGMCRQVVLPGLDGSYGVLPGHEPMVTAITAGIVRFQDQDGTWHVCVASDGCVEVMSERVILLAPLWSARRTLTRSAPKLPSNGRRNGCARNRASGSTMKRRRRWPELWLA